MGSAVPQQVMSMMAGAAVLLFVAPDRLDHNRFGNPIPPGGFIPDERTAEAVAEPILRAVWGEEISDELPLKATLDKKGVWIVKGTWKATPGRKGGVSEIWLLKKSGEVVKITGGM